VIGILFGVLVICLILGFPVAFCIGISAMSYLFVDGTPLVITVQKMIDGVNSFTMLALPMFVFSGSLMAYGSTPRIMKLANLLLHKQRGGLGSAAILGCAAFGTISGSGVATCSAIGSVMAPEMVKQGYGKGYTAALVGGAGTLGSVIPPSICFVVYAQMANVSVGDMFLAGVIPGIGTALLLCLFNSFFARKRGWCQERVDYGRLSGKEKRKIIFDAIPPLMTPVIILGGVFSGAFTPTEAAATAVVYSIFLSVFVYKELNTWKKFLTVCINSAVSSAVVLIIIALAQTYAWLLTTSNLTKVIGNWITGFSSNTLIIYSLIVLILLFMGTFLETTAIILLTTPIFLPILQPLGVHPLAYGVALVLALCVGGISPPLAVTLYTGCRIVGIRMEETMPDVWYICGVMTIATFLVVFVPQLATFLPGL